MKRYKIGQVCRNGHKITVDANGHHAENFCTICGAETITQCSSCLNHIRGDFDTDYCIIPSSVPSYCLNCGQAFPWTERAITNARLIVQEEEGFSDDQIKSIIESLPDIIAETPSTNLAAIRIKKALVSAGKFTAEGIRQFVIDFGCELAKKSFGL